MKIIIRADDVGYTEVNNIGAFETIDNGVTTSADVMLDCPGTEDALRKLKERPWISVGWHTHFWGSPVLPARPASTVIDTSRGHFRTDLRTATDYDYDELLAEMRAQIERCIDILGRAPDTGASGHGSGNFFDKAVAEICREYGIVHDFAYRVKNDDGKLSFSGIGPKWADRKIYILDGFDAYKDLFTDSIEGQGKYDPVLFYTEDRGLSRLLPEGAVSEQSWHPGYVDYYMCREGDKGPHARKFIECRPMDVHALCSDEIKAWIKENQVELVNFRDALYGTQEYQNHLRNIGSDLCMTGKRAV